MNLYFDNAATSYPKPEAVYTAAESYLRNVGGNPGRASHKSSLAASRFIYDLREIFARFFNFSDPSRIVFTLNATDALNMAIKGFVKTGDHVIYTAMEHNSVLRPVGGLVRQGLIDATMIPCSEEGVPDLGFFQAAIRKNTSLVIINHASNVCGTIMPLNDLINIAHDNGITVLVDAAQTAGILPIDVNASEIDMLAFCGHKGLLGHPGTGGLYVKAGIDLRPWREGGTGSYSDKNFQPGLMPDRLEAGTINSSGLAGLAAGLQFIQNEGLDRIRAKELALRDFIVSELVSIPKVRVYGKSSSEESVAVISFIIEGLDCGQIGFLLEENYGISCRTGLHCAPLAHKALKTYPEGTVRISPGYFTTHKDAEYLIKTLRKIAES